MLSASSASLTCHARTHDVRHRERLNFLGETRRYPRFRGRKSLFISYTRAYIRGLLRFHPAEARVRILRLKGARAARYNFTPGISKRRVRAKCTLRPRFMGRRRNRKGFEAWRNYYIADAYIYKYIYMYEYNKTREFRCVRSLPDSEQEARIRGRKYSFFFPSFFANGHENDRLMATKEKVSIATPESSSTMSEKKRKK